MICLKTAMKTKIVGTEAVKMMAEAHLDRTPPKTSIFRAASDATATASNFA